MHELKKEGTASVFENPECIALGPKAEMVGKDKSSLSSHSVKERNMEELVGRSQL